MDARPPRWCAPLLAATLLLPSCSPPRADAELVVLGEVDVPEVRPGAVIRVRGAGFVPGPVDLRFSGVVSQPGTPPAPWSFVVQATAASAEEIAGLVPDGAVDVLHGLHGRFRGELIVRFAPPPTPGLPALVGRRTGISVPMSSEVPASRETRAELAAAAQRFLARIGLEVDAAESPVPGEPGLVFVRSRSPGARPPLDEVVPGDRLVAADGVLVTGLADLAPDPRAPWVTLTLAERGSGRAYDVHVLLRDEPDAPPAGEALALLAALAVLGFAATVHFAGFSDRLARLLSFPIVRRGAGEPADADGQAGDRVRGRGWRGPVVAGAAALVAAAAPLGLYHAGRALPSVALWGAAIGVLLVHRVGHAAGDLARRRTTWADGLRRSFGALASAGAAAVPLTASVALALWGSAALTAGGAVTAQDVLPLGWAALRDPCALLLAVLALAGLGAGFTPGAPGWRLAIDTLAAGAGCLLLALVGFGGWNAGPFGDLVFAGLPVPAWAFEAKVALLVGAVVWYGRRRWARGLEPRRAGLAWLAALPLALGSAAIQSLVPEAWMAAVVRPTTAGLAATVVLAFWFAHRQRAAPAIVEIHVGP
jgi:hypothetical protein